MAEITATRTLESDLPPADRLAKLRALEEWLDWQLNSTRQKIRQLEQQEADERRRRERARAEQAWKLQPQRSDSPAMLHRGGCQLFKSEVEFLGRREALIALTDEELHVECCPVCRPETGLRTD